MHQFFIQTVKDKNQITILCFLNKRLYLWEKKVQVLPIDDLNDWYQDWLQQHQEVQAQYQNISHAELEQDLRNSTLLVRFAAADFGFTHSSMQEFFIAQKLTKTWQKSSLITLTGNISALTRQFILDGIIPLACPVCINSNLSNLADDFMVLILCCSL
jgi:hypothetical protein